MVAPVATPLRPTTEKMSQMTHMTIKPMALRKKVELKKSGMRMD